MISEGVYARYLHGAMGDDVGVDIVAFKDATESLADRALAAFEERTMTNALEGWVRSEFTADGRTRDVFRRGSGPGVIVIHEIPGITPKVAAFANDVVDSGFTVVMPSLVGTPGRAPSVSYGAASMIKVCIAREFTHLGTAATPRRSSAGCGPWPPTCTNRSAGRGSAPWACASAAGSRWG